MTYLPSGRVATAVLTLLVAVVPVRGADPVGQQLALLVGVRKYDPKELRDLPYAEADVEALARTLCNAGYQPDNVVLMTQSAAARDLRFAPESAKIRRELKLLLGNRAKEDTLLIAFAGHGVQFSKEEESYFCPADARLADRSSLISLSEVYRELKRCPARVKVLLVDACRNDPLADHSRSRATVRLESSTRPAVAEPPAGLVALFSCSEGERAFEHDELKHGVFFHYVIEALRGEAARDDQAEVTVADLESYVQRGVDSFVRSRFGASQRPERKGEVSGAVPLVRIEGLTDLRRGRKHVKEHQYEAAVTSLTRVLRATPRHAEAFVLRARAYSALERYDDALSDSRQALDLDPRSADSLIARASAFNGRKEYDQAIADCNEALRLDAKLALAYAVRAYAQLNKQNADRALADVAEAMRLDPKLPEALHVRGLVHLSRNENALAVADFSRAHELDPNEPGYLTSRGAARIELGEHAA